MQEKRRKLKKKIRKKLTHFREQFTRRILPSMGAFMVIFGILLTLPNQTSLFAEMAGITVTMVDDSEFTDMSEETETIIGWVEVEEGSEDAEIELTETADTEVENTEEVLTETESSQTEETVSEREGNTEVTEETAETEEPETELEEEEPKKPAYTVTEASGKMYTTTSLNVRKGPSTDYAVIGVLSTGQAVDVTGWCKETGWYRIAYSGQAGFSSGKYLTETKPQTQKSTDNSSSSNSSSSASSSSGSSELEKNASESTGSSSKNNNSSNSEVTKSTKNYTVTVGTEGDVGSLTLSLAQQAVNKIPEKLLKKFADEGWNIAVTSKDIATTYASVYNEENYESGSVAGITIYVEKQIYVADGVLTDYDGGWYTSALHEIGHWLDVTLFDGKHYISAEDEFMALYEEEKDSYIATFGNFSTEPVREFFAHCFYRYIMEPDALAEACPGIKAWFDKELAEYK